VVSGVVRRSDKLIVAYLLKPVRQKFLLIYTIQALPARDKNMRTSETGSVP
jgi:hypothetical protein